MARKKGESAPSVAAKTQDLRKWCGTGGFQPPQQQQQPIPTLQMVSIVQQPQSDPLPPQSPLRPTPPPSDPPQLLVAHVQTPSPKPPAKHAAPTTPATPPPTRGKKSSTTPPSKQKQLQQETTEGDASKQQQQPAKRPRDYSFLGPRDNAPTAPGTKNIPHGSPTCLEGLTFIVTGRLEGLGREDAQDFIKKHGGQLRSGVTSKLSYLVVGEEPGESKMEKAQQLKVKCINEDELYELVRSRSPKVDCEDDDDVVVVDDEPKPATSLPPPASPTKTPAFTRASQVVLTVPPPLSTTDEFEEIACVDEPLWCDKYRPKKVSDMAPSMAVQRLTKWLQEYEGGAPQSQASAQSSANGNGSEKAKKAILLSGPPGVGKTTAVHVVAKERGYDVIEFNASDTRNATALRESLSDTITNQSIFMKRGGKLLVLIDEVDGCDRGGVGELIKLIKKARVPLVCTCNDRWDQKLRSLVNHVEDVRVARTAYNSIATYVQNILRKEGVNMPTTALQDIIIASGNDFRSVLNNVQMWVKSHKSFDFMQTKALMKASKKDDDVGLFDSAEAFLSQGQATRSIAELKSFFYANDMMPLFIQENYIHYKPDGVVAAAHCIAMGDVLSRKIMMEQRWDLSNAHFVMSALYPTHVTRGSYNSFAATSAAQFADRGRPIKFPAWLGNNSTATKNKNATFAMLSEGLLNCGAPNAAMDYFPVLRTALTSPLRTMEKGEGVKHVMKVMDRYGLRREDWDSIMEITGLGCRVPNPEVPSAAKSSFTREFNKSHTKATVSHGAVKRSENNMEEAFANAADDGENEGSENGEEKEGEEKNTLDIADKSIVAVTTSGKKGTGTATTTPKESAAKRRKK